MLKLASVLASMLFVGCASSPSGSFHVGAAPELPAPAESAESARPEPISEPAPTTLAPAESTGFALEAGFEPPAYSGLATPRVEDEGLRHSRFTVKGGYYSSEEDGLDDGWIVNLSWMRFFTRFFALELEAGYLDADGTSGAVQTDLWGIPLMVNGRLNVPLWVLDLYGGLGVGTIYYDIESAGGAFADDGWVLGGNAFLGATVNLADSIALGLEAKYYLTEDISSANSGIDALAILLTLGFSR